MIKIETISPKALCPSASIQFFRFGAGKETMVILPGMSVKSVMDSAEYIATAYSRFAVRYTVYVFDVRKDAPDVFTPGDAAEDTAAAMLELGIGNADVFGVSLGGMTAQMLAAKYPGLVRKLVLGSTASRLSDESKEKFRNWIEAARNGRNEEFIMQFAEAVYSDRLMKRNRSAFVHLAKIVTDDDVRRFISLTSGIIGFDTHIGSCGKLCPVLVLGAGKDKLISRELTESLAKDTNAELYIYEEYTHSAYDEAPDYKDRIQEFFGKQ